MSDYSFITFVPEIDKTVYKLMDNSNFLKTIEI